jgi:hypothetical protein
MLQDVPKWPCLLDLSLVRPSPTRSFFTFVIEGSMSGQTSGAVWIFWCQFRVPNSLCRSLNS